MKGKWWSSKTKVQVTDRTYYDGSLIGAIVLGIIIVGGIIAIVWLAKSTIAIPGVLAALSSIFGKTKQPKMTE